MAQVLVEEMVLPQALVEATEADIRSLGGAEEFVPMFRALFCNDPSLLVERALVLYESLAMDGAAENLGRQARYKLAGSRLKSAERVLRGDFDPKPFKH